MESFSALNKLKAKLARTQGAYKANEVIGSNKPLKVKPVLTPYKQEKLKIKHFYEGMAAAYSIAQKYDKLIDQLEKERKDKENPPPKGVTFTL